MHEIFADYLGLLEQADSARITYTNNHRSFELLTEFLEREGLDAKALRLGDLGRWLKELCASYANSTVSRHASSVSAAYKHARELGVIDVNPTSGLRKLVPTPVDKMPETFSAVELRALHAAIQTEREETVFHLLLWTGCRAAELRPLRWSQAETSYVDFEHDQLVIYGKGGKIRFVPLHPILRAKLEDKAGQTTANCVVSSGHHREMSHQTWTTEITGIMERAGVLPKEKKSHIFRKTLNTNLNRQDVDEHVLDLLFGWAPTTVRTRHYSGVSSNEVRSAILKAYIDDPVVPEQGQAITPETDLAALVVSLKAEVARLSKTRV